MAPQDGRGGAACRVHRCAALRRPHGPASMNRRPLLASPHRSGCCVVEDHESPRDAGRHGHRCHRSRASHHWPRSPPFQRGGRHGAGPGRGRDTSPGGPPVLLLHGWPYDIHSFVDVVPVLSQRGYRVIVPYLRGYGTTRLLSSGTVRKASRPWSLLTSSPSWMPRRPSPARSWRWAAGDEGNRVEGVSQHEEQRRRARFNWGSLAGRFRLRWRSRWRGTPPAG